MRERRPGNWELIVQLPRDAATGKPKQLSRSHVGTKREAQRALAALVAQVAEGKISSSSTSLNELLARWLDQVDNRLSPTTAREYRRIVNRRLGPDLGRLRLSMLTTQRIDAYYAALTRDYDLSPGTVRHVHAILRGSLGQAVKWGWIPFNPAISASPPKLRTKEITPPSLAATRKLLATADEYDVELAALLRVLAATGARRGEVCGIRWSDIDGGSRTLSIKRSIASIPGGTIVKDTKSYAARRIALDDDTIAILELQRDRAKRRAEMCELAFNHDGYVFTATADGSDPLHPDTITKGFARVQKRAGLHGIRLHDLRHLHATKLLAAGVPVPTVSGRLGHANSATTLNVYAHFLEASDGDAADVIGNLLGRDE